MTTPAAFRGLLRSFDPGSSADGAKLVLVVDRAQLGHILVRIGTPPAPIAAATVDAELPSVAFAPCALPRHPEHDGIAIGSGFIGTLITMLQTGELPFTPQIALQLDALREVQTGLQVAFAPPGGDPPSKPGDAR